MQNLVVIKLLLGAWWGRQRINAFPFGGVRDFLQIDSVLFWAPVVDCRCAQESESPFE
jgi:hypothetical protein